MLPTADSQRFDPVNPQADVKELSDLVRMEMGLSGDINTPNSVAKEAASQLGMASEGVDVASLLHQVSASLFGGNGAAAPGQPQSQQPSRPSIEQARWYWKEDANNLGKHNPSTVKGEYVE